MKSSRMAISRDRILRYEGQKVAHTPRGHFWPTPPQLKHLAFLFARGAWGGVRGDFQKGLLEDRTVSITRKVRLFP